MSWIPFNFLALPPELSALDRARVVLVPVPYDSTASYRSGARDGPRAIIEASRELEDYDLELNADVSQVGIYTTDWLEPHVGSPEAMVSRVREAARSFASQGKLVGLLGGEHSIAIGAVQALKELHPALSVLFLDAHADLRDEYMGTRWGHASVARRIHEVCPLVQVGVRTVSQEEWQFIQQQAIPCFTWPREEVVFSLSSIFSSLSSDVYLSIDLDVLEPSLMPAVGNPEPGGMAWTTILSIVKAVAENKRIVGFDVCELCPREGPNSCAYVAAKLVYKVIAYATLLGSVSNKLEATDEKLTFGG